MTEWISGVNIPACQLLIGMGVPLYRIPDIRRLYGKDPTEDEVINFEEDPQLSPSGAALDTVLLQAVTALRHLLGLNLACGIVSLYPAAAQVLLACSTCCQPAARPSAATSASQLETGASLQQAASICMAKLTHHVPSAGHVVAVRVTSEDANENFKPTAGSIDELVFQPSPDVWGYFSVKSGGGIHSFSDSQVCFVI